MEKLQLISTTAMQNINKEHIAIAVIGNRSSGKSTLCGHLLSQLSPKKDKILAQIEQYSAIKPQTKFAWVMNTLKIERDLACTQQTTTKKIETGKYIFSLIDVPGTKSYTKNILTGLSQADTCLLVVDAIEANFTSGFEDKGQTKDQALLAYALGIKQIIVAINKMDAVQFKEERYTVVKRQVTDYLKKVGFEIPNVRFIPISAYNGNNLFKLDEDKMGWYKEVSLVQALDQTVAIKRYGQLPLRIPIERVHNVAGVGTVPVGKIESGVLKKGMKVVITPGGFQGEVKTIESCKEAMQQGNAGDIVGIGFTNMNHQPNIKKGCVIGAADNPPKLVESFLAQVVILNHPNQIKIGFSPIIQCHTAFLPCRVEGILSIIDRRTGTILEENPKSVKNGDCAMMVFKPLKPLSCEPFNHHQPLGRFVARDNNATVAVGVIKKCEKKDPTN